MERRRLSKPRRRFDETEFALIYLEDPVPATCHLCARPGTAEGYAVVWKDPKPGKDSRWICAACAAAYAPTLVAFAGEIRTDPRA